MILNIFIFLGELQDIHAINFYLTEFLLYSLQFQQLFLT